LAVKCNHQRAGGLA